MSDPSPLVVARVVATIWRDAGMREHAKGGRCGALMAHPMAMVMAALDGETDPVHLGCDPAEFAVVLARLAAGGDA